MGLEALIFDVDGTVADTEEVHRQAFNAAFSEAGYPWVWDRGRYKGLLATAGGRERLLRYLKEIGFSTPDGEDLEAFAQRLHERKTTLFGERLAGGGCIPLRPGVERLIGEAFDSGLRLAIATTTSPGNVEALFAATAGTDVLARFEVIGAGDCVAHKKPAPDIYSYVLHALNLAPDVCLAIEDSANGLESANAAGVGTVITVATYTADETFIGARAVLSDLGDPGIPFEVLEGDVFGKTHVDVELLRRWHSDG